MISQPDVIITHGNQLVQVPDGSNPGTTDRLPILSVEAVNHIVEEVLSRQVILSNTSLAVPEGRMPRRKPSGLMMLTGSQRWLASTASQLGQVTVKPTDTATVYLKVSPHPHSITRGFFTAVSLSCVRQVDSQYDLTDD